MDCLKYGRDSRVLGMALLVGLAALIAGCGGSSRSISVTEVSSPVLTAIVVTPANPTLGAGRTEQFTATGTYSDGSQKNVTASAEWASSAQPVATISNAIATPGLATGVGSGKSTITATVGSIFGSTTLTVTGRTLLSIAVTPSTATVAAGTTQQFAAVGTFSDGTQQTLTTSATWASDTAATATISNAPGSAGLASALAVGTSSITATYEGITSAPATLTVIPGALVSILVTPASAITSIGGTVSFVATGTYSDGTTRNVTTTATWASATTATATISNAAGTNGIATGVALGSTLITASIGNITSNAATLTVTSGFAWAVDFSTGADSGSVSQFGISGGGSLTALTPASVPAGQNPYTLAVDPSHSYLYVVNYAAPLGTSGSISQYRIAANGTLTPMNPPTVETQAGPSGIVVNPTGPYVYVADFNASVITQYTIGAGGALAPMAVPSVTAGAGLNPSSIAVNPAGTFVYAADYNTDGVVYQYSVGPGGALTPLAPPSVPCGKQANWIVVDPSGRFVYTANAADNTISQFTIGLNGELTPVTPATVPTGADPRALTVDAKGQNLYVVNQNNEAAGTVWQYTIGPTGALTFVASVPAGTGPSSLAFDPTGQYAYVTDRFSVLNSIAQFAVAANGTLTPLAVPIVPAGAQPAGIITAP
jgi:6-phosphogluconolactonase (cycloisomerase 2 family)